MKLDEIKAIKNAINTHGALNSADAPMGKLIAQVGGDVAPRTDEDDSKKDQIDANSAIPVIQDQLNRIKTNIESVPALNARHSNEVINLMIKTSRFKGFLFRSRFPGGHVLRGFDILTNRNGSSFNFLDSGRLIGVLPLPGNILKGGFQFLFLDRRNRIILRTIKYKIQMPFKRIDGDKIPVKDKKGAIIDYKKELQLGLSCSDETGDLYGLIQVTYGNCYWFEGVVLRGVSSFINRPYPFHTTSQTTGFTDDVFIETVMSYFILNLPWPGGYGCGVNELTRGLGHSDRLVDMEHRKNNAREPRIGSLLWQLPDSNLTDHSWVPKVGFLKADGQVLIFDPIVRGPSFLRMNNLFKINP